MRSPQQDQNGRWETSFVLTQDAAKRFETLYGREHRQATGDRAGQKGPERADNPEPRSAITA